MDTIKILSGDLQLTTVFNHLERRSEQILVSEPHLMTT